MNNEFYTLNSENDVINLEEPPDHILINQPMFKLGDLLQKIKLKLLQIS
jgi:hypothetical protein